MLLSGRQRSGGRKSETALSEFSVKRFYKPFLPRKRFAKSVYESADYGGDSAEQIRVDLDAAFCYLLTENILKESGIMTVENNRFSVTILGSGTCVPSLRRSSSALMMEIRDTRLLFDCGPGTLRRLLEAGTDLFDISFVFLSHFHPDHAGDFASFLFSNKYADVTGRKLPLTAGAGNGFSEFYHALKTAYPWIELSPDIFRQIEFSATERDTRDFGDFTAETLPVEHNKESVAYKITDSQGKTAVYSGDTDFSANLVSLAKDADLFICESALPDEMKVRGHLTPCLAGEIATLANVRKLVLTHFYPQCDRADIEKQCRKTYSGPLLLAEDLMRITI